MEPTSQLTREQAFYLKNSATAESFKSLALRFLLADSGLLYEIIGLSHRRRAMCRSVENLSLVQKLTEIKCEFRREGLPPDVKRRIITYCLSPPLQTKK